MGKDSGKGWGKGKGGKGFGKSKCPPDQKVWIGGFSPQEFNLEFKQAFQEHMKQAGDCKRVSMGKGGTGSAEFSSAEEATMAIATLNGSDFQGTIIEVDTWTQKDGSPCT